MGPPAVGFGESRKDVLEADEDACGLPGVIPSWLFWRQSYFEIQRWSESDHPIITTGSDDDD